MKLLIASDIHGSAEYCRQLIEAIKRENPLKVLLLGDLLYHGPRNDLPAEYAPKEVAAMLNGIKEKLICVRGNCDTEVDQMMLEFPVLSSYAELSADNRRFFLTHGHVYNAGNLPPVPDNTIIVHGHTHTPEITRIEDGIVIFNSCSHAGADVIIYEAMQAYPEQRILAMIGGFHLFNKSDEYVRNFAHRVEATGVEKIYTGHCSGKKALSILMEELGDKVHAIKTGLVFRIN
jgi:putative phosphoesterase